MERPTHLWHVAEWGDGIAAIDSRRVLIRGRAAWEVVNEHDDPCRNLALAGSSDGLWFGGRFSELTVIAYQDASDETLVARVELDDVEFDFAVAREE